MRMQQLQQRGQRGDCQQLVASSCSPLPRCLRCSCRLIALSLLLLLLLLSSFLLLSPATSSTAFAASGQRSLRIPLQRRAVSSSARGDDRQAMGASGQAASDAELLQHRHELSTSTFSPLPTPPSSSPSSPSSSRHVSTPPPDPAGVRSAAALLNFHNIVYTGPLQLGDPPQLFTVVYDTGSADLWVFSAATSLDYTAFNHYYDHRLSASYSPNGSHWAIEYGEGAASGYLSADCVQLAGRSVRNQTFAEAISYSDNFRNLHDPTDGILGLSFSAISESHSLTVVDSLYREGAISRRVFSFFLTPQQEEMGSVFILGEPDPAYAPRGLHYFPIVPQVKEVQQWVIGLDAVQLDGKSHSLCSLRACVALLDTGTSFIGIPSAAFLLMKEQILSMRPDCSYDAQHLEIQCSPSLLLNLPTLHIVIGGVDYALQPADYMIEGVVGIMQILPNSGEADFIILGDTFLKTYYTVFDMDNERIGIAVPDSPQTAATLLLQLPLHTAALLAAVLGALLAAVLILCCASLRKAAAATADGGSDELKTHCGSAAAVRGSRGRSRRLPALFALPGYSYEQLTTVSDAQPRASAAQLRAATPSPDTANTREDAELGCVAALQTDESCGGSEASRPVFGLPPLLSPAVSLFLYTHVPPPHAEAVLDSIDSL